MPQVYMNWRTIHLRLLNSLGIGKGYWLNSKGYGHQFTWQIRLEDILWESQYNILRGLH